MTIAEIRDRTKEAKEHTMVKEMAVKEQEREVEEMKKDKKMMKHSSQRLLKPLSLNGLKQNIHYNASKQGIEPRHASRHVTYLSMSTRPRV